MNDLDKTFIRNLGYEVIEHPQALERGSPQRLRLHARAPFIHVRDLFDEFWPAVPSDKYDAKTNELLKEHWPDEKKVYERWVAPYVEVTTSHKLVIMNEKYPSPSVVAYVAKTKW
ncbi:MAG: hypothetical protein Q9180_007436 [Flavoplaca navasiana]